MKITESKLVGLIMECFNEVMDEELSGYGISKYMDAGEGDIDERNAQEIGMTDDEVVKRRIERVKDGFYNRNKPGFPSGDKSVRDYVDSFPDKAWDWHRLFRHELTNDSRGKGAEERFADRYGQAELDNLNEVEDGLDYTHYAVNKQTNKIVNGWDYHGYDPQELRQFKKDYFISDLIDYELDPKQYVILSKETLVKRGINPDDQSNWANS